MTHDDVDLGPSLHDLCVAIDAATADAVHFRQFFTLCPLPCAIYHQHVVVYVNDAYLRHLHYTRDQIVGRHWHEFVCDDCESKSSIQRRFEAAGHSGGQFESVTYKTGDGRRVKMYVTWHGNGFTGTSYAVFVPAPVAEGLL